MTNKKTGPFSANRTIILASGSPRRRELLNDLGLDFTVHPSQTDEPFPFSGENSIDYAKRMATMKTLEVANQYPDCIVLGADTIVVLDGRIMGKPTDKAHAFDMLSALSGKTHQVISAFCVVVPDSETITQAVSTDVDMRISSTAELKGYINTGEPMDKAGAYAIQGIGTFLVTAIRGSYTNVVGLPLARVLETLLTANIIAVREDNHDV